MYIHIYRYTYIHLPIICLYISLWGRRQNTYGTTEGNKKGDFGFFQVDAAYAYMYDGMGLKQTHWVKGGAINH